MQLQYRKDLNDKALKTQSQANQLAFDKERILNRDHLTFKQELSRIRESRLSEHDRSRMNQFRDKKQA